MGFCNHKILNTPTLWKIVTTTSVLLNSQKFLTLYMPFTVCAWIYHVFWWKANWGEEFSCSYSNSCDLQVSPLTQEPAKTIFFVSLTRETLHTAVENPSWWDLNLQWNREWKAVCPKRGRDWGSLNPRLTCSIMRRPAFVSAFEGATCRTSSSTACQVRQSTSVLRV
jgi:hypothetical protein